jgi:hypothetical protein
MWSSPLPDYRENHLTWADSSLADPIEIQLTWVSFGHCIHSPASLSGHQRTIWSEWTQEPDGLPLSHLWPLLTQFSLPAKLTWELSDLSGLDPDSLLWFSCSFSLEFPLDFICGLLILYGTLSTFCSFNDCIFCDMASLILFVCVCLNIFFGYISVLGNIFQVFWS